MKTTPGEIYTKLIASVVIVLIGVYVLFNCRYYDFSSKTNMPVRVSEERYGGEAYTGIQNAGAQTANNVHSLYFRFDKFVEILLRTIGLLLILLGVEGFFVSLFRLSRKE